MCPVNWYLLVILLDFSCRARITSMTSLLSSASPPPIQLMNQHTLLVDLQGRNIVAAGVVEMLNSTFIQIKHKRSFNFYTHVQVSPNQNKIGFFGELVDEILRRLSMKSSNSETIAVRVGLGETLPSDNDRHYSVLLVDSCAALSFLYKNIEEYHMHISGYYIILLYTFKSYYYDELLEIFALNWKVGIIDANVLVYAVPKQLLLFSAVPYNELVCGGHTPVIKNRFFNGQWQHSNYHFPNKMVNLHGCPLFCAAWKNMPYMEVTNSGALVGIEGKMLQYLSKKLNFTLKFYWLNDEQIAMTLHDDGAIFYDLFSYGIDFAIGAFRYKPVNADVTYTLSIPYYLSSYSFVTSSQTTPYSPFVRLLLPFVKNVWYIIAVYYLCCIMVTLVLRFTSCTASRSFIIGAGNRTPIYNMFIACLGGAIATMPGRNFARCLLMIWLVATLVLRNAYQAFMYHFIRTDLNQPPPADINALFSQNFSFLMTNVNFKAVEELKAIRSQAFVMNATNIEAFDWMRSAHERVALLSAYEYFGYYKRKRPQATAEFYVMPQKVFTQQLSIYLRKNSIFLKQFDNYLMQYVNTGLMSKWENVFIDRKQRTKFGKKEEPPQPMALIHLQGAFRLLVLGYAVGFVVLVMEVVRHVATICLCFVKRGCRR